MMKCLSRHDAAKALAISVNYLDQLVAEGRLSSVRIGRRRLFDPADLEKIVAESKESATTEATA